MGAPDRSKRLGVALIGVGMIAKTHVTALSAIQDKVRLKAIVSRHPENALPLAVHYTGAPPTFTSDLEAIAADPDIHFAIVATPPNVRCSVIEVLAQAGKHILLEKPVGRTYEEAQAVVELCVQASVTLGVLFQHRMRASSLAASHHVASGKLGRLGLAEIAVPLWRDQSYYNALGRGTYERDGGGVMLTNAIHSIDLALSLTGPITQVQAMTATTPLHQMEAEDFAVAGLRFACGAVGSLVAGTAMFPHRTEVIRLHFEHGSLRIDKNSLEVNWRDGRHTLEGQTSTYPTDAPQSVAPHKWHQAMIEDFTNAVLRGTKPLVTGYDALQSHRLIQAIEASSRSCRSIDLAM